MAFLDTLVKEDFPYDPDLTSDEDEKEVPKSHKDEEFRRQEGYHRVRRRSSEDSGTAESIVKLLVSLLQHRQTTGKFLPLPLNELTGVHDLLYDYYGSEPDLIWNDIIFLQENIASYKSGIKEKEKAISEREKELVSVMQSVSAIRSWKEISNITGQDATAEGVEIEKKSEISGKEFLTRLIGPYKKLPSPDIIELPIVSKSVFVKAMTDNYSDFKEFLDESGGDGLRGPDKCAGPLYANANDENTIQLCVSLTKLIETKTAEYESATDS